MRAHPRSRGENADSEVRVRERAGSSPLTRGKHVPSVYGGRRPGLIPAHAGKTPPPESITTASAAHPRSRGENFGPFMLGCCDKGSSPLTRGKRTGAQVNIGGRGLIPAHAGKTRTVTVRCIRLRAHPRSRGKTRTVTVRCIRLRAHPRSRGENLPLSCEPPMLVGSSPLTRGKPYLPP